MGSNATFVAKRRMLSNFRAVSFSDGFGYCEKMLLSTVENVAVKCFEGRINAFYSKQTCDVAHTLDEDF